VAVEAREEQLPGWFLGSTTAERDSSQNSVSEGRKLVSPNPTIFGDIKRKI
jgi:hypothetical protein